MTDSTRPTLEELHADGLTPEIMIQAIDAQRAMAGEYFCTICGAHGDEAERIEACRDDLCGFRNDDGQINAPYQEEAELLKTRAHYESLRDQESTDDG